MIKCLYCGYECPDNAQMCPNCGKPIIKIASGNQPTFADIKEAHLREKAGIKQEDTHSQKQVIIAACVLLILASMIYKFM